jgi:hypothetical protein
LWTIPGNDLIAILILESRGFWCFLFYFHRRKGKKERKERTGGSLFLWKGSGRKERKDRKEEKEGKKWKVESGKLSFSVSSTSISTTSATKVEAGKGKKKGNTR